MAIAAFVFCRISSRTIASMISTPLHGALSGRYSDPGAEAAPLSSASFRRAVFVADSGGSRLM